MSEDEPKIFIDEDWKSQVEREREQAKQPAPDAPASGASLDEAEPQPAEAVKGDPHFVNLVSGLAAQCMFALGMVQAEPGQNQVMVDLGHAQLLIDTLVMIRTKTVGNLEPEEEGHLREVIAELQQIYAARAQQVQEAALRSAKINPRDLKGGT
jgi:hypothetical protein